MVSGDENQFDGLWNRFSFVGLPQFKTAAFTETPADLGTELDQVYRALSKQKHQTHWLSLESKPLWEAWHNEIEDKILSGSTGLVKGTYSKFHGIAGRNALILHRTLAAINKTEPEQLISAAVMELAIGWTKWELSQTLLQYQLLGLTNDPELARILKFIDKFAGNDWVNTADVRSWWSTKSDRTAENIRQLMAKVVLLGYAIDNELPTDSSKYQIKIIDKSARNARKNPETNTGKQENMRVTLPAKSPPESAKPLDTNVWDDAGNFAGNFARKHDNYSDPPIDPSSSENAGNLAGNFTRKVETAVNGNHSDFNQKSAGNGARIVNNISSNGSSNFAGNTGTFYNDLDLQIGVELSDQRSIMIRSPSTR